MPITEGYMILGGLSRTRHRVAKDRIYPACHDLLTALGKSESVVSSKHQTQKTG
jgi:hypothetical protein